MLVVQLRLADLQETMGTGMEVPRKQMELCPTETTITTAIAIGR